MVEKAVLPYWSLLDIIDGGGNGNPLKFPCPEKSHGQRNLVGCDLWGQKESDRTELLSTHSQVRQCLFPPQC